jgi:hypothetical protein
MNKYFMQGYNDTINGFRKQATLSPGAIAAMTGIGGILGGKALGLSTPLALALGGLGAGGGYLGGRYGGDIMKAFAKPENLEKPEEFEFGDEPSESEITSWIKEREPTTATSIGLVHESPVHEEMGIQSDPSFPKTRADYLNQVLNIVGIEKFKKMMNLREEED